MTCYVVGHLHKVEMSPSIVAYLEGIDATLALFQGRYIIHGGEKTSLEGQFQGDLIVIAFPDRQRAEAWYHSPAYQALLPRRTEHAQGDVFLIGGVDADHKATDVLR